jgi:hypothetical protein
MNRFSLISSFLFLTCCCVCSVRGQDAIREVRLTSEKLALDSSVPTLIEAPASEPSKFYFPYYLYVPSGLPKDRPVRLLVEPNNTGQAVDDFEVHRQSAKRLASQGYVRRLADRLQTPLLVPVFPRPLSPSEIYTHLLSRDTLLVKNGPLLRIDLQLLNMVQQAREALGNLGISTKPRIFMDGFSASAGFVNRFAALHPEAVRALAAGGINALPMYPLESYEGVKLPFPLGIADMQSLTGAPFNARAYRQVSQYLYMGYLDRNDTYPFTDAWNNDERSLIAKLFGREMMPDRWTRSQEIISTLQLPIQTVTYNGVGHQILPEMWVDIVAFFKANDGDTLAKIAPHEYPFVAFREIREAHVKKLYWEGDPDLPEAYAPSFGRCTFVIAINDWMKGQNSDQLQAFVDNAGFEFDLVADGQPEIHIDRKAFWGTTSYKDGEFQGFYVLLTPAQITQIAPEVPYSLRPKKVSDAYTWTVPSDVVLLRRDKP